MAHIHTQFVFSPLEIRNLNLFFLLVITSDLCCLTFVIFLLFGKVQVCPLLGRKWRGGNMNTRAVWMQRGFGIKTITTNHYKPLPQTRFILSVKHFSWWNKVHTPSIKFLFKVSTAILENYCLLTSIQTH